MSGQVIWIVDVCDGTPIIQQLSRVDMYPYYGFDEQEAQRIFLQNCTEKKNKMVMLERKTGDICEPWWKFDRLEGEKHEQA